MLIEKLKLTVNKKDGTISKYKRVRYTFKCDNESCGKIYQKGKYRSKSGFTFCSNKCKFDSFKIGGKLKSESEKTCLQRYGTKVVSQSDEIKNRQKQVVLERYGTLDMLSIPKFRQKYHDTIMKNHGVTHTFKSEELKEKRKKTWMENYGVPYRPFPQEKCRIGAAKAMEKHPNKWSSKGEIKLAKILERHFGEVIRQKRVNNWPIDIYVPAVDTYIQFDGVYWHGLDRPIETIKESIKPRDISIYQKWQTDRVQEQWFKENGLNLIRITDIEFEQCFIKR